MTRLDVAIVLALLIVTNLFTLWRFYRQREPHPLRKQKVSDAERDRAVLNALTGYDPKHFKPLGQSQAKGGDWRRTH